MNPRPPRRPVRVIVAFSSLLWLLAWPAVAQEGILRFDHLSVEDGLPHSTVTSILQDRIGFLWLATQEGLSRWDGYRFEVYRHDPADKGSLANSEAYVLLLDRRDVLWVGTFGGGLDRFMRAEERFDHHRHDPSDPDSLSNDVVLSLVEDADGALWAGTDDGLNRLRDGVFTRYRPPPAKAGGGRFTVEALLEDRSGRLWIGTPDGLYSLDREAPASVPPRLLARPDGSPWGGVNTLLEDPEGRLWVGTSGGLERWSLENGTLLRYRHDPADPSSLGEDFVQRLFLDRVGELWVGTISQGLDSLDRASGTFRHARQDPFDSESLSDNAVLSIFEDATGILYFGSYVGVSKYDRRRDRFVTYRQRPGREATLSDTSLWALHEDRRGELWVGTYDAGLDRLDRDRRTVTHYPPDPADPGTLPNGTVSAITEDRSGTLWIGTWGGLSRFDRDGDRFVSYRHDPSDPTSLSEDTVYSVLEDSAGRLWVGTYRGLNRLDRGPPEAFVRYPSATGEPALLAETPIYKILEDRAGDLWFGSDRDGLFRLRSGRFDHLRHDPADAASLSSDKIATLFEDRSGILWIGTYGSGLARLDAARRTFRHYRRKDGLASDSVFGILEDDAGRLWLATSYGLSRFDPRSESFRNYDAGDGLQGNVFSTGSALRSPSGEMYFGGIRGLTAFHPERIEDDPSPPPVAITDFLLFNRPAPLARADPGSPLARSILVTEELALTHRDYVFALGFAALHFASPRKNRYAYRLEGFDRDWVATGADQRLAQYSNLSPGRYVFRVKASNADGVWNEEGAALRINVLPPPWRTWWAWCIYLLAAVAAAALFRRSARRKLERARQRADREAWVNRRLLKADRQKSELIAELEAKNVELERFTYTVSHDLKSPLLTIRGFLGLVRKDSAAGNETRLAHDLERLDAAADKMTRLLDDLLKLSRVGRQVNTLETVSMNELIKEAVGLLAAEIAASGVAIDVQPRLPPVVGDRNRLVQVLQNLLHNAIKYMGPQPEPRIRVGVRPPAEDGDEPVFFVRDNGVGIEPADREKVFALFERLDGKGEGTGVGLALVKRIVEVHGGRIWVESEGRFRGSTFCFTLARPIADELASGERRGTVGSSRRD